MTQRLNKNIGKDPEIDGIDGIEEEQDMDLYAILELSEREKSTCEQIKKNYHRLALKFHPDKMQQLIETTDKEEVTKKFQNINFAYSILSDTQKKSNYDATGSFTFTSDDGMDWKSYFDEMFGKIGIKDILEFEKKFKGSEEESEQVLRAYSESKGDMQHILDSVLCASTEDEDRFRIIIMQAVEKKSVKSYKKFINEAGKDKQKRKRAAEKEAKEAEEMAKELGISTDGSIEQLILKRHENRAGTSFLDQLEQKYSAAKKPKRK